MRHGHRGEIALTGIRFAMYVVWSAFMAFTTMWFLITLDSIAASMKLGALTKVYKDVHDLPDDDRTILIEKIGKRVRRGAWKRNCCTWMKKPAAAPEPPAE